MPHNKNYLSIGKGHLPDYLTDHFLSTPHKTAFIILGNGDDEEDRVTYAQLANRVMSLAAELMTGKLEGQRVLLVYENMLEFTVSFLACQYAGIVPVPAPYARSNRQMERLRGITRDCGAAAILCAGNTAAHLQQGVSTWPNPANAVRPDAIDVIPTTPGHSTKEPDLFPSTTDLMAASFSTAPAYQEIAFIQYTSGSTGNPKGVLVSHENLLHNQQLIQTAFGCDKDAIIFSWLPFHHDMGLIGNILHTIYTGCTGIFMSPLHFMQSPLRWLKGISRYKATHSGGPNFAYDLCVDKIKAAEMSTLDLSAWRVAYNGSEPVRPATLQRFADFCKPAGFRPRAFSPCYGLAEATLLVCGQSNDSSPSPLYIRRNETDHSGLTSTTFCLAGEDEPGSRLVVSSGKIVPETIVKIIETRRACGELEEGEICISGDSITRGYWNQDNSPYFYTLDGRSFLRTGDLGFIYNGELFVHGRLKEMLIVRGRNFYPSDIEALITTSHTAIETNGAVIFPVHEKEDIVIVAELKRSHLKNADTDTIISSIDKAVNGFFSIDPLDIILTTPLGIPRTTSGKLQRVKCGEIYRDNAFVVIASKQSSQKKQADPLEALKRSPLVDEVIRTGDYTVIRKYLIGLVEAKIGRIPDILRLEGVELTEMGLDSLREMELLNTINRDLDINIDITKLSRSHTLSGLSLILENILWLKYGQTLGQGITL